MKFIIVSNPTSIYHEADLINQLFDEGLAYFHLRKPDVSEVEIEMLLSQIDDRFHDKIALHQHHQLASKFGINRLHYTEYQRKQTLRSELMNKKVNGFLLSTSVHQMEDLKQIPLFDRVFYGPVFNSISKKEYLSKIPEDFYLQKHGVSSEVIAIGGVADSNLSQVKAMNFDGFAVLGFIWQQPEIALHQFKNLQLKLKLSEL